MKIKISAIILPVIVLGFVILCCPYSSLGQVKFIPNLGQWNSIVRYRTDVLGGRIYLSDNEIRYNFIDARDIEALHSDPYKDKYTIHGHAVFLQWLNANPKPVISSKNEYPEYYNFYQTHNASGWRSGVHAYSELNYANLYPKISMKIEGFGQDMKYTYTVAPGGDPAALKMKIKGAKGISLIDGDLVITTNLESITEKSPYAYQLAGDDKKEVPCSFRLIGNVVSFIFPQGYDKTKPLVIDPLLIFATYSGSTADNFGFTGTFDSSGNGYSGGDVYASGFPTDTGSYQQNWAGGTSFSTNPGSPNYINIQVYGFTERDVGILKYTADGKNLIYATYLGGAKNNEQPHSMVVDNSNNLVVIGTTASSDFPVTASAYKTKLAGKTDIFVSKFSPDGKKLLASTFMGGAGFDGLNGINSFKYDTVGSNLYITPVRGTQLFYNYGDQFRGDVIADKSNNVYVASSTMSTDFPTTSGSYQPGFGGGGQDGCVFKLDSTFSKLVWSTYLGGSKDDGAYSIQLDALNNVFVSGGTMSPYFFPSGTSYQSTLAGDVDGYVCHIKGDGSGIIRATYIGTVKYDQSYFVQLDKSENVYLYGQTESSGFPVTNVKYSVPNSGNFITKFNNGLDAIIYSTLFGSGKGMPDISPTAFLVDKCEKIYISGWGGELFYPSLSRVRKVYNMPITADAFQKSTVDSSDFYVAVFERNLDTLLYSSYFGGPLAEEHVDGGTSRFDKKGIIYQSVCGGCQSDKSPKANSDFPTTPGAYSRTNNSKFPQPNCNNLLFKVDLQIPTLKAGFIAPKVGCQKVTLNFKNISTKAKSFIWDFGDTSPVSTDSVPKHFYKNAGIYTITLVAINPNSCEVDDTFKTTLTIYQTGQANFKVSKSNCSLVVNFQQTGQSATTRWDFGDGAVSNDFNGKHTYAQPGKYKVTLLVDSGTLCADTFSQTVVLTGLKAAFSNSFQECSPEILQFTNLSTGALQSRKWYFPQGSTDTAKNPHFDFKTNGVYSVSLVVTDSFGCKDSIEKILTINAKTKAAMSLVVDSCLLKVTLKNLSVGSNAVHWDLGDPEGADTSNLDSLVHIYKKDTSYTISLIVNPGSPCADTLVRKITFRLPRANYGFKIDTCSGKVNFEDKSTLASKWLWKFTNTDTDTQKKTSFTYVEKGTYPVKLVITSSAGCKDSATLTFDITKDTKRNFHIPNVFTPNEADNINKKFVVQGLSPCYTNEIWIYNRWGQELFHAKGSDLTWDGYYKGQLVKEGDYYYVFHGHEEGELKGTVTVIY